MNEWYRSQLKKQLPAIIQKWEKKMNIKIDECQVKIMKTKWGSCHIENKRIWINLELAKKPHHCLEYIIVHEMVHFGLTTYTRRNGNHLCIRKHRAPHQHGAGVLQHLWANSAQREDIQGITANKAKFKGVE
jgi:hypothetical protein